MADVVLVIGLAGVFVFGLFGSAHLGSVLEENDPSAKKKE